MNFFSLFFVCSKIIISSLIPLFYATDSFIVVWKCQTHLQHFGIQLFGRKQRVTANLHQIFISKTHTKKQHHHWQQQQQQQQCKDHLLNLYFIFTWIVCIQNCWSVNFAIGTKEREKTKKKINKIISNRQKQHDNTSKKKRKLCLLFKSQNRRNEKVVANDIDNKFKTNDNYT